MAKDNVSILPISNCDNSISYSDFNLICRLCLASGRALLSNIRQTDITFLKHIADLQVLEDDELPKTVCTNCTQSINYTLNFVNICKRSHIVLTSILLQEKILKEELQTNNFNSHDAIDIDVHPLALDRKEKIQDEHLDRTLAHSDVGKIKYSDINKYCKNCNLFFKNTFHLKNSSLCQSEKCGPHKCEFCNTEFISGHQNEHTGRTPYKCSYCPKEFKFKSQLTQHIDGHQQKLGYAKNKAAYTEKRVRLKLKCRICEKVFSSRSGFQYHKWKHDGKVFKKSRNLKNKSSTRPYLCNYCAKGFYIKSHLDDHLRIHTGEKPFKCNYCSKEFRQKSSLNRHKTSHKDMDSKLFLCKICQKKFTTKAHRDIHTRIHTGEKPHKCEVCQKCFNYKTQWRIHLRLHTGETPYACGTCSNTYHDKGSLRKHQKRKGHFLVENSSDLGPIEFDN